MHGIARQIITERFAKLEPSVAHAHMTVYLLADAIKEGIISMANEADIYEKQVKPFVKKIDAELINQYEIVRNNFSHGNPIGELPPLLRSANEPLSQAENDGYKKATGELNNVDVDDPSAPSLFEDFSEKLKSYLDFKGIMILLSVIGTIISMKKLGEYITKTFADGLSPDDKELIESIRHYSESTKFRQAMRLYAHPELASFVPEAKTVPALAAKKIIDTIRAAAHKDAKLSTFRWGGILALTLAVHYTDSVDETIDIILMYAAVLLSSTRTPIAYALVKYDEALAYWRSVLSTRDYSVGEHGDSFLNKIKAAFSGTYVPQTEYEKEKYSLDRAKIIHVDRYIDHKNREMLLPSQEDGMSKADLQKAVEKSQEQDKIPLPLYPKEKPFYFSDVGDGLYVVTVYGFYVGTYGNFSEYRHILVAGPQYENILPAKYFDRTRYSLCEFNVEKYNRTFTFEGNNGNYETVEIPLDNYSNNEIFSPYTGNVDYVGSYDELVKRKRDKPTFICPANVEPSGEIYRFNNLLKQEAIVTDYEGQKSSIEIYAPVDMTTEGRFLSFKNDFISQPSGEYSSKVNVHGSTRPYHSLHNIRVAFISRHFKEAPPIGVRFDPSPCPDIFRSVDPTAKVGNDVAKRKSEIDLADYELAKLMPSPIIDESRLTSVRLSNIDIAKFIGNIRTIWQSDYLMKNAPLRARTDDMSKLGGKESRRHHQTGMGGNEVRRYNSGDDAGHIDWKKTAKSGSGEYYVRHDVDVDVPAITHLVVDARSLLIHVYYVELFMSFIK